MAFEWPLDKLGVINSALAQTGDNLVAAADNGSDEWNVASPAYERAVAYMIEQHNWLFAKTFATLQPATNVPTDDQYDTAYNLPSDCVHVIQVRISDLPAIYDFQMGPPQRDPASGQFVGPSGMQLVINAQGGPPPPNPPQTPAAVTLQYISSTTSDPTFATPTFVAALERFVMAGIYRGLHEDMQEARAATSEAMSLMQQSRTRHDQQRPKMAPFNSRMTASRRIRRPWPAVPTGWGGTGTPG